MKKTTEMLEWALAYHKARWPIFPCWNKQPLFQLLAPWDKTWHRVRDEGVSEDTIRDWWTKVPDAQIALACGSKSKITVIDIDWLKDPTTKEILYARCQEPGELAAKWPTPLASVTGGKGRHLFFLNADVPNSVKALHEQIDIRSEGGYVILPPSIHENGRKYEWDAHATWSEEVIRSLPPFPQDLLQAAKNTSGSGTKQWSSIIQGVPLGSRNNSAAALAGKLLRTFDEQTAWDLLDLWNNNRNQPPLPTNELTNTFVSILKKHYRANPTRNH